MNCIIGGPNVKSLARAVQSLARVGDDMYIESSENGLVFRTVNSSRSAYVCFTFKTTFFAEYNEDSNSKCKVSLKSCLMAFRSLPTVEKTVEKCVIGTNMEDCMLLIEFHCKHDLTKVYQLPFIENETVQAVFKDQISNCKLTAQSKMLLDSVQNFSNSVEEVTLTVSANDVVLKNYIDDDSDKNKVVYTEFTFGADDFDHLEVKERAEVTFCIKELKAMLAFAEGFNVPVCISCHSAGKPIMFSINGMPDIVSEFVLATLAEKDNMPAPSASVESPVAVSSTSRKNRKPKRQWNPAAKRKRKGVDLGSSDHGIQEPSTSTAHVTSNLPRNTGVNLVVDSSDELDFSDMEVENGQPVSSCVEDRDHIAVSSEKSNFRSQFLGLTQCSQYSSMLPECDEVLAEASDLDD